MNENGDRHEVKRQLRQLNAKLERIASRIRLIYFMTFLLPVLVAAGAGFYYAGGVEMVERTYRQWMDKGSSSERSDDIGDMNENTPNEERSRETDASRDGASTTEGSTDRSDTSAEESPEENEKSTDEGPAADWNPGGEETEKARRRREGFEEKSPIDPDDSN